jgi:DtxR family Mn-dependent transcriptional regulator
VKDGITSHLEDYLEAILMVARETGQAHASAVAEHVGVTRASVTGALRALADRGLIVYQPYQPVTLTAEGLKAAQACADRHEFLHKFFRDQLGMDDAEADTVACRVEHSASATVLSRLAEFSRFLAVCRKVNLTWTADGSLKCAGTAASGPCRSCERSQIGISE